MLDEMALRLEPGGSRVAPLSEANVSQLTETDPPKQNIREPGKPLETKVFRARKVADYSRTTAKDARIGKAGDYLSSTMNSSVF